MAVLINFSSPEKGGGGGGLIIGRGLICEGRLNYILYFILWLPLKNVKIAIRLDFLKVRRLPFPVPVVLPQKTEKNLPFTFRAR